MLRIMYRRRHRNLSNAQGRGGGPQGRINKMRQLVTSLVRHERIEGFTLYLDESRGYAERVWYTLMTLLMRGAPTFRLEL